METLITKIISIFLYSIGAQKVQRHHRYAFNKWGKKNTMGNGAEQILVVQRAWRINRGAEGGN
jgi:hypothetical protein